MFFRFISNENNPMTPRYPHTPMKLNRPVILSIVIILLAALALIPRMNNRDKQVLQLTAMIEGLAQYHYLQKDIDDDFSEKVFDQFLNSLDGNKRFFLASDIQKLEAHKQQIDDQIHARTFEFFQSTTALFRERIEMAEGWYLDLLAQPFSFTTDEQIETDSDKLSWSADEQALKKRWRNQLKYEVLFRIYDRMDQQAPEDLSEEGLEEFQLIEEDLPEVDESKSFEELEAEAREAIRERYEQWFKRLKKSKTSDYFSEYLNSIANIFDPHTSYFEPVDKANFDISMSGKLEGIGARLQTDKDDTKVVSIVPGGPAWKQKELEVNDIILKVAQGNEEPVVLTGMNINEVVSLIRGPKGTEVRLTVRKVDGSIKVISIIRDEVILDEGFAKSLILRQPQSAERIGYIRLPRFYADFESKDGRACANDMRLEIEKLKNENVKGIIIDLRSNGGGSLRDVVTMTGYFIEKGPIVQVRSRAGRASVHDDRDPGVLWDGPLIVMVNEFSASASEIMAAALQDYGRAVIVGSPATYGKGTVQRFFDLDNAITGSNRLKPLGELKLTIQNFYRVNGGSTQLRGVEPDILLPDNYMFLPIGEKEYPHAMPFSEIPPLNYSQNVYHVDRALPTLKANSAARIEASPHFQKTKENARRFERQREQTAYPLSLEAYKNLVRARKEEAEQFKDIFPLNEDLIVLNPAADKSYIQTDSSRIARNDDFIKNARKDMHLDETMVIMLDMISLDRDYARGKK
jgi:carboxyl-terminal processing protease